MVLQHARSVLMLVTVPLMSDVEGKPGRRDVIPNAYSSAYGQSFYDNVGHMGDFRDSVSNAGFVWTLALCQADHDLDGQSNGLEVGDPCCTWAQGTVAQFTTDLSYPGEASSMTSRSMPTCYSTSPNGSPSPASPSPPLPSVPRWAPVDASPAHEPLRPPAELRSRDGELSISLELGQVRLGLAGNLSQLMASYNGSLPAPTLRLSPGDQLIVHLTNGLASGATNLHMHGLHVSPNEDDTFAQLAPGTSLTYRYTLPSDHHAGTFWYHPHYHPTQTVQAGAGAFGMVIVDPPVGSLPADLAAMSETILVLHHLTDSSCAAAGGTSLYDCASRNVPGAVGAIVLVNGQHAPRIASDGGWSRWRLLFNAVNAVLEPQVPVGCEAHLLAKDGLYLQPAAPRRVSAAYLAPGSRADWLVACTAGVHELSATLTWESGATETVLLAHVGASASASSRTGSASSRRLFGSSAPLLTLPFQPFAPPRPCYLADLRSSNPTRSLPVSLEGYSINGRSYHGMVGAFEAVLDLGEVYQLEVTGAHETHPLHLHTNAFQIVSLPAAVAAHRSGHFAVGDWHDTLVSPTVPTTGRSADRILVRFVTDRFGGRVPLHCHGLNHADGGMMVVYFVRGAEGTSVPGCAVRGAAALEVAWVAPSASAADGIQGAFGAPIGAASLTLTSVFVGVLVGVLVVCLALCLWRSRSQRVLKLAIAGSSSGSVGTRSRRSSQDWHAAQGKSSDDDCPDDESCASTDSLLIPPVSYMFLRSIYVSAFHVPPIR